MQEKRQPGRAGNWTGVGGHPNIHTRSQPLFRKLPLRKIPLRREHGNGPAPEYDGWSAVGTGKLPSPAPSQPVIPAPPAEPARKTGPSEGQRKGIARHHLPPGIWPGRKMP